MTAHIHYTIQATFPQNHLFTVTLTIMQPHPEGQIVRLPVWIPGSYVVRDFARHIVNIKAQCAGKEVSLCKQDKSSWQLAPVAGVVQVCYQVYAYDLSVRGAYVDTRRGFFNGASVFLAVVGQEDQPCEVTLKKPPGKAYQDWKVASSLPIRHGKQDGFNHYYAKNYDALIDHPVEWGTFSLYTFIACGIPHDVAIAGRPQLDHQCLLQDMQKICTYQIGFFGQPAPFDRYVFLILATATSYGGLEHRASTALICSRDDFPQVGQQKVTAGYRQLLGLVSHEYFHSWNVKRIKPHVFAPYDLTQENYTRLLWAFEGITSYYDDLTLVRTGLISVEEYLLDLSKMISGVLSQPGSAVQTVEEASFDAWIKYYRPDENSPNSSVSYYTKGAIVALLLDATIRHATKGTRSLDDVMRTLWQRYGKHFSQVGQGIEEHAWEEVAQEVTGVDLKAFFKKMLRQTSTLPLKKTLAYLGIDYQERPALSCQDRGGEWQEKLQSAPQLLGLRFKSAPLGVCITHVFSNSPAELAGLAAGDILLAMNGLRVEMTTLEDRVANYSRKQRLTVHVFRDDELMIMTVKLFTYSRPVCALRLKTHRQRSYADSWLEQASDGVIKAEKT